MIKILCISASLVVFILALTAWLCIPQIYDTINGAICAALIALYSFLGLLFIAVSVMLFSWRNS